MHSFEPDETCPDCQVPLVDAGDELVCVRCGITEAKEVFEGNAAGQKRAPRFGSYLLGSYMGTKRGTNGAGSLRYRGLAGTGSRYSYLKTISDHTGREDGASVDCARMVERVGEKLRLPKVTIVEATSMARRIIGRHRPPRLAVASVSAHSLIAACKIGGISAVDAREIIKAHESFGKRVTISSIIRVAFSSPFKTNPRRAEDFVRPILGRLSASSKHVADLSNNSLEGARYLRSLTEASYVVLSELREDARWGRRPSTLAATAVYTAERILALREDRRPRITQREVAEAVDSSEYTIREQCSSCFRGFSMNAMTGNSHPDSRRRRENIPPGPLIPSCSSDTVK